MKPLDKLRRLIHEFELAARRDEFAGSMSPDEAEAIHRRFRTARAAVAHEIRRCEILLTQTEDHQNTVE